MPTGYTAAVQDGAITDLRIFALRCARAFGPLISMRDDALDAPIPERLYPDITRDDEAIAYSTGRLAELEAMSVAECDAAAKKDYADRTDAWNQRRRTAEEHRSRYEAMLDKVRAWSPPEAIEPLRDFMAKQLLDSIRYDCERDTRFDPPPHMVAGEDWRAEGISAMRNNLAAATRYRDEEIARTAERNLWLDALRTSLVTTP
jgi:hypothetical protein